MLFKFPDPPLFKLERQFDYWGDGFNFFDEGTYSFRAKVTDFVGNESYTNTKTITVDLTAPELQSVLSYDAQNDQVIFNAPTDAYEVYKWVNNQWQAVKLNNTVGWDSAKYKVIATDAAGNIAEKIYNIGEVSGTYKPDSSIDENIIKGTEGSDYLYGGDQNDILISYGAGDRLYGGKGDDTLIYGGNSNQYMLLQGGEGVDTYIIDKKLLTDGSYIHLLDEGWTTPLNNILYLNSVLPEEVHLKHISSGFEITFNDLNAKISVSYDPINRIYFDDGTVWDHEYIKSLGKSVGTEENDELLADSEIYVIEGLGGDDHLIGGEQDDLLYGDAGNDTLIAFGGTDNLYGGQGNDILIVREGVWATLRGDEGSNTYVVNKDNLKGYVHILPDSNANDTLKLEGFNINDVVVTSKSNDLEITFNQSTGTINIYNQLSSYGGGVDFIEFDDGTIWDRETILNKVNALQPTLFSIGEESLLDVLSIEDTELFDHSADGMLLAENSVASLLVESTDIEVDLTQFVEDAMAITTSTSSIATSTLVSNYRVDVYDDLLMPNTMSI